MAVLLAISCRSSLYHPPDLHGLYDGAAQYHLRNPIVVIPGLMGTRLVDPASGRTIWGAFGGGAASPKTADGLRLLALPLTPEEHDAHADDDVSAGVLDRVKTRIFGIPLQLKAYANILATLGAAGYLDEELALAGAVDWGDEHFTCFQFPYDWRHDNAESARRLHEFLLEKRTYVEAELERRYGIRGHRVKFDIVAHSMGGLLLRHYLLYGPEELPAGGTLPDVTWAGRELVERAVLIAPPNGGSVQALIALVEGLKVGPLTPRYPAELIGTYPSSYQLLPRNSEGAVVWSDNGEPVLDLLDPELWQELGWGLASPDADRVLAVLLPAIEDRDERRRVALQAQSSALARARRFQAAIDREAPPLPEGLELMLILGDSEPTASRVAVDRGSGGLELIDRAPGDGTVLRSSALLDRRTADSQKWTPVDSPLQWTRKLFLFSNHLGMTRDPMFSDNVLHWLLEEPRASILVPAGPPP